MLKNYFKISFRNIIRYKGYSFINIAGLAIGMACCILILSWVLDELSYDRFHESAEDIYRIETDIHTSTVDIHTAYTSYPLCTASKAEIPVVIDGTRYMNLFNDMLLSHKDRAFYESEIKAVDPNFLQMFNFPLEQGDKNTALEDPSGIVITEKIAEKYFGDENPLGKMVTFNNTYEFTVTGILKNLPHNSTFQFDILVPLEFMRKIGPFSNSWGANLLFTYVKLRENSPREDINAQFTALLNRNVSSLTWDLVAEPLTHIHLYSFGSGSDPADIKYVYIFSIVAFFVLMIACINFMNLSTARSANRAKEIGLRKVVGATKKNVLFQFYVESVFLSIIAFILAFILVFAFLPQFNRISGKTISFEFFMQPSFLAGLLAITLFTGIIAGSYPALYLSGFRPVKVLRGALRTGAKSSFFRKVLVVAQFAISIFLIIGTIVVFNQLIYMKNKNLGYDKEHVVYMQMRGDANRSYNSLKKELLTKEIGIRKVLGASVPLIFILLSKEFLKWVLIANVIAWPAAYFTMKTWLQGFAYSTELSILTFIFSTVAAFVIALFTVSFQTVKAAVVNPVSSLKHE